jgi:glucose/arabinose dehydrogenase
MGRNSFLIVLAGTLAMGGCGGSNNPPGSGGSQTIRGTERLGWDQVADSPSALAAIRYVVYVDGTRTELPDVTCANNAGTAGFACSSRLPSLSPGQHTLELASYVVVDGAVNESPRSAGLVVVVSPSVTAPAATAPAATASSESRAAESRPSSQDPLTSNILAAIETVVEGLDNPVDLTVAADGRLFIAERGGTIRIARNGQLDPQPALVLDDDLADATSRRPMSLALHPEFERTRFVYLLHSVAGRDGSAVFRLSRYRETEGILGERAVLLDGIPRATRAGAGSLRFGPDQHLYVALDDGDDRTRAGSAASYNGKVLRLNDDGSTPADQPARTPIIAAGLGSPCGLDWDGAGLLWIADCRGALEGRLVPVPVKRSGGRIRSQQPLSQALTGAVFYQSDAIPAFNNALLLASADGLLRVRFDSNPSRAATIDRVLDAGAMTAVAVSNDGTVFGSVDGRIVRIVVKSGERADRQP